MEFFIIMVPPIVGSVYMIWHLRRLKKHDHVLFKFCQTRRDVMTLLREENYDLRRPDYLALRYLAVFSSGMIHHFNDLKKSRFNARKFVEEVRRAKLIDKKIKKKAIKDERIGALYHQFERAHIAAFFAFTPFFTSEIVLRLLPFFVQLLAKVGLWYFRHNARRITDAVSWVQEEKRALAT
ncbi:MAG: hypothetical protein ACJ74Q_08985 [Pyrinomonadaceae bacterium]